MKIGKHMKCQFFKWPSIPSFALVWVSISLLTWGLACFLALSCMYGVLEAGLIPVEVLLALWLAPVSIATLTVQTVLFMIGRVRWPESPETNRRLVLIGTPLLTWLSLVLLTYFSGGPDAFVPRL